MDIYKLIDKQLEDTRQNQISFQATIKKRLKKHGFDREKLGEDINKDFNRLSKKLVHNAFELGLKWLAE